MFGITFCAVFLTLLQDVRGTCSTVVAAQDRIDCHPNPYDQSTCEASKCVWCTGEASNIPKCFVNETEPFKIMRMAAENCQSSADCKVKVDCHPDIITYQPTKDSCTSRGCLWLESQVATDPKCVYYNNTVVSGFPVFPGKFPIYEVASVCTSCSTCTARLNCLPHLPSSEITEDRCIREGCLWCGCTDECIVAGTSALATLGSQCQSCTNCSNNAYLIANTKDDCEKQHATWCDNREANKKCIVLHDPSKDDCSLRRLGEENCTSCSACQEIYDCSDNVNETAVTCEQKGCLWCANNASQPSCRYGSNGYTCSSKDLCGVHYPRFQKIEFKLKAGQLPHTEKLMEVFCYSQLGIWNAESPNRCLSASPLYLSPIFQDIEKNAILP